MSNETARPWQIQSYGMVNDTDGNQVPICGSAFMYTPAHNKVGVYNLDCILKAVNAYDELKAKADMFDELFSLVDFMYNNNGARWHPSAAERLIKQAKELTYG